MYIPDYPEFRKFFTIMGMPFGPREMQSLDVPQWQSWLTVSSDVFLAEGNEAKYACKL